MRVTPMVMMALFLVGCADQITQPPGLDEQVSVMGRDKGDLPGENDTMGWEDGDEEPDSVDYELDPVTADCGPGTWCESTEPEPELTTGWYEDQTYADTWEDFDGNSDGGGGDACDGAFCEGDEEAPMYVCPDPFNIPDQTPWGFAYYDSNRSEVHKFNVWGPARKGEQVSVINNAPQVWYWLPPGPWEDQHGHLLWSGQVMVTCFFRSSADPNGYVVPVTVYKQGFGPVWRLRNMDATF